MLEDEPTASMPPRSRLFGLPLAGEDPYSQEALLDFAQRLSLEHHVRVRDMFAQVILPEAHLSGAFFVPGHFSAHALRGCNGWSAYACAFLAAMQRLTGRVDMSHGSLAYWAPLLDSRGYAATTRRWCPECLRAQRGRGFHSFSLLWAFEAVRVCPIHRVTLSDCCGRCGRPQPLIGNTVAQGLCEHCHAPLRDTKAKAVRPTAAGADFFKASAVAGMICSRDRAVALAVESVYRTRLQETARTISDGSIFRLEKQLNLSYMSLGATRRHTLGFFLEVMYRLGVEPMPFLAGAVGAEPNPVLSVAPCRTQRRFSPAELSEVGARVVARLDRAKSEKTRLTTRREFVKDVGISNSSFQTHFEEAMRALREHNNLIRPAVHDALWERRSELISKAMTDLVERRGPFSAAAIGRALTQAGTHRRNPRVRKLAHDALLRAQANADGHHDIQSD